MSDPADKQKNFILSLMLEKKIKTIQHQMVETGIQRKHLEADLGIPQPDISLAMRSVRLVKKVEQIYDYFMPKSDDSQDTRDGTARKQYGLPGPDGKSQYLGTSLFNADGTPAGFIDERKVKRPKRFKLPKS